VVYDLGCGDGRIVIAAARDSARAGVGIDIDPRRIEEAKAGARSAGVEDKVRFAVQDLVQDRFLRGVSDGALPLSGVNARLRPKLLAELRPGARVVAHQFASPAGTPIARRLSGRHRGAPDLRLGCAGALTMSLVVLISAAAATCRRYSMRVFRSRR
jgi:cyclopropane fatty-acyl-phospholipid synthase-like methyltransferase